MDRAAAVGCALRLVAGAAATRSLRAADLSAAALPAIDRLSAVVESSATIACAALWGRAVATATHGRLSTDFTRGTAAAVMHLTAAVDKASALATGFFAALRQAAAIVDAALAAWTSAALDRATAAVGQAAAHARELIATKRYTRHAFVIEALLIAGAAAAFDRIARAQRRNAAAFGALGRTRTGARRLWLRWLHAAMLAADATAAAFAASLGAAAAIG